MSKQSRRTKPLANGADPGPIEKAIDTAAAKAAPVEIRVLMDRKPIRLKADGRISIKAMGNPNESPLLLRGPDGLWHGVILPPGSTWELRPSGPAAQIWTPTK
jgi:hypothetical protein